MKFIHKKKLELNEKYAILELWNNEYPKSLSYKNITGLEDYLEGLKDQNHILLIDENQEIKGWYFDFIREDERWFATIIDSAFHGKGLGVELLNLAMHERSSLNGWVIVAEDYLKTDGSRYRSPIGFYKQLGFSLHPDIKLETDVISAIKISWTRS